jgi:hypothetical protein
MAKKRAYRKGMDLFHNETKQKIMFGNWATPESALCLTSDKQLLTLSKADLDTNYTAYSEVESQARERRRGQGW